MSSSFFANVNNDVASDCGSARLLNCGCFKDEIAKEENWEAKGNTESEFRGEVNDSDGRSR